MNNLEGSSFLFSLGFIFELGTKMSHRHGSCNTDNVFMWYYTSESKYRYIYTLHVVFPYSLENYNMHFHFHRERTSNSTVLFWQRILQTSKSTELIQLKQ